jgi:cobyrinic acid a,c-diamide synthase
MGAAIVPFSPLHDQCLPPGLHGLYLGGGYPEAHAAQLSKNSGMLEAIRGFTRQGRPVYAECGGLMYLGLGIQDLEGNRYELAGLLPAWTRMLDRLKSLGYAEVVLSADSLFGPPGTILRGHEFHYSELVEDPCAESRWSRVYQVGRRRGSERVAEGYARGRILASYVHLHFGSNLSAARAFIAACRDSGQRETPTTGDT